MNKLYQSFSILLLATMLSGCMTSFIGARFDNNEYFLINSIRTTAEIGVDYCGTNAVKQLIPNMWVKSLELKNYASDIPGNGPMIEMSIKLHDMITGLNTRYKTVVESVEPSTSYCTLKFKSIIRDSKIIQRVVGDKPRWM